MQSVLFFMFIKSQLSSDHVVPAQLYPSKLYERIKMVPEFTRITSRFELQMVIYDPS